MRFYCGFQIMIIKRQSTRDVRGYLQIVLNRFPDNREIYDKITKLLKDLRLARLRSTYNDVISKVSQLFKEHKDLLLGFNKFLPPGYKITLPKDQTQRRKPEFRDAAEFINKVKERLQDEHAYKSLLEIFRMFRENKKSLTEVHHEVLYVLRDHQDLRRQSARDVLEYLQIVLNRFPDNREIYDKITKLLKDLRLPRPGFTYNDVISKVSQLFKEHKDLLLGFNEFLPPGYKITLPEDQTQRKKPELRDASEFLNKVKERLQDEHAYKSLLEILRMFKENKKSFTEVHHELFSLLAIDDTIEKIDLAVEIGWDIKLLSLKDRIIDSHTDRDLKPEHRDLDHERSLLKESKEEIRRTGTKNDNSKKKLTLRADDSPEISNQARGGDKFCGAVGTSSICDEKVAVAAAEKEWCESGTRCGGQREGQLKKERETRDVERALNVVEEMERAEEQFVKEMEVTRRNWEPASQVMTVVGVWRRDGGRRGFDGRIVEKFEGFDMLWHVGLMEVRGVGEVRRKGKMVGEGFVEREGAFILMLNVARLIFVYGIANHLNAPYLCKKDEIVLNCPHVKEFCHDNIVTCSRDGSAIIWIPRSRRSHVMFNFAWSLDNRFVLAAIM
ncbi:hypothetical protein HID58_005740, partial [Brassica napus]